MAATYYFHIIISQSICSSVPFIIGIIWGKPNDLERRGNKEKKKKRGKEKGKEGNKKEGEKKGRKSRGKKEEKELKKSS